MTKMLIVDTPVIKAEKTLSLLSGATKYTYCNGNSVNAALCDITLVNILKKSFKNFAGPSTSFTNL